MHPGKSEIRKRLSQADTTVVDNPYPPGTLNEPLHSAAVLVPLLQKDHDWHILVIRRATNAADYHSGQMALPGGRTQPEDDSARTTALREAYEEIGLHPDDVEILGGLNRFATISDHIIEPVVGILPWPYTLTLQESEVSEVFTVPLDWLTDPDNHQIRQHRDNPTSLALPVAFFREYEGMVIWGVTARIILAFTELMV